MWPKITRKKFAQTRYTNHQWKEWQKRHIRLVVNLCKNWQFSFLLNYEPFLARNNALILTFFSSFVFWQKKFQIVPLNFYRNCFLFQYWVINSDRNELLANTIYHNFHFILFYFIGDLIYNIYFILFPYFLPSGYQYT